jgi:hypothetical protein
MSPNVMPITTGEKGKAETAELDVKTMMTMTMTKITRKMRTMKTTRRIQNA